MGILIERNKSYKKLKYSNDIIRLQKSSDRHNKNMFEEQKRLEEKALKNKEKIFQKYMTFYYFRKSKEREQKLKNSQKQLKLAEKSERLEEINKKEKLRVKELNTKFEMIERKKIELLKNKTAELIKFKEKRNEYNNICKIKKENMLKELSDIRLDILDYQSSLLSRDNDKVQLANLKRNQSTERTLNDQLNLKKNIKPFFKKLEFIKSENVMRKSMEEKKKLYLQSKKEEAERKKREEEEKLMNMDFK